MAPIDRSCSYATLQPNMYIEKFNISWLSLYITDVVASVKNTWYLRALIFFYTKYSRGKKILRKIKKYKY